jgi:hypothetical protein
MQNKYWCKEMQDIVGDKIAEKTEIIGQEYKSQKYNQAWMDAA